MYPEEEKYFQLIAKAEREEVKNRFRTLSRKPGVLAIPLYWGSCKRSTNYFLKPKEKKPDIGFFSFALLYNR